MAATPVDHHRNGFRGHGAEEIEAAAGGHPLLTSWNPPTQHSFSKTQMKTLTSVCDAFSPSIDYLSGADSARKELSVHDSETTSADQQTDFESSRPSAEDMAVFYGCSASDMGVPEDIAGLLSVLLKPKLLAAIRVFLWLLSTRLGTVILGGRASLIWQFPFCQSFSNLPRSNQETILRRWSLSMFGSLRAVYKLFKMITMWVVYTKIEKNGQNRTWKAIGYCGADPHVARTRKVASSGCAPRHDPVKDIVIESQAAGENLHKVLDRAGVAVVDDISPLKKLAATRKWKSAVPDVRSRLGQRSDEVGISCDVVVVGSGSGGGVAASVLAKAGYKVVVLEKGKHFTTDDFSTLEGPSQMAMFEKLGSLATEDGGVNLVAGATVGGGTTINWSVCFETPPHILHEWKEITGLDLFTSTRYQLAMCEVWRRLGAQPHATRENLQNSVLRAGCEKLGIEVGTLARNAPPDHDCGWCTSGCPRGQKGSTAATWLVDAAESGNAVIMSECEAEKILYVDAAGGTKQYKARGVVARVGKNGSKVFIDAQAVVVASGSLMTPPLLLNSGLRNPNIGKGLHLHPVVFVWGYFPGGPRGTCYEGAIMTSYSPIYTKFSSRAAAPVALLEVPSVHPGSFAGLQPWTSAADFKQRMAQFSRTVTLCVVTRDESSGQVSVEPDGAPVITYTLNESDEQTALQGMEKGLRVLIAAGAAEIGTHQQDGERFCVKDANPNDIEAYLKRVKVRGVKKNQVSIGSGHHMSSCKMGSDPKHSVVDGEGESWEVESLFVCDGSVLPNAVGVNPMVTIQSLAYCIAHSVLQSLQSQYKTSPTNYNHSTNSSQTHKNGLNAL